MKQKDPKEAGGLGPSTVVGISAEACGQGWEAGKVRGFCRSRAMKSSLELSLGGKVLGSGLPPEGRELLVIHARLAPRSEPAAVSSAAVSLLVCF